MKFLLQVSILFVILDKSPPILGGFFCMKPLLFLQEVREELDKVVWPTREQTIRYTILVIIVTVAVGLILGGLDYVLTLFTSFIINK